MKTYFLLFFGALLLAGTAQAFPESNHPAMTDPSKATETAPTQFVAKFETTKGDVVFDCTRSWAPNGVDRFYNLVKIGYFQDVALFRVNHKFVVQWGIHGNPNVSSKWASANLRADPVKQSNKRGTLTYAMAGAPTTRSTQLFINYKDNAGLDRQGFAPLCTVTEGMDVADKFYGGYEEKVTEKQDEIRSGGNAYLRKEWPKLDYIINATIVSEGAPTPKSVLQKEKEAEEEEGLTRNEMLFAAIAFLAIAYIVVRRIRAKEDTDSEPKKTMEDELPKPRKAKTKRKKKSSDKSGATTSKKKSRAKKRKKPPE